MKKLFLIITAIFLLIAKVYPETFVKCETSPEFAFSEYKVFITTDFITPVRKLIARGAVGSSGFNFKVDNVEVWALDIEINDFTKRLYVEKNSEYVVKFKNTHDRNITIVKEPSDNLNVTIQSFTKPFDTLNFVRGAANSRVNVLSANISGYISREQLKKMREIVNTVSLTVKSEKNKFISGFYKYYLAPYRAIIIDNEYGIDSLKKFKNSLFENQVIQYNNPAYASSLYIFALFVNKHIYIKSTKRKELNYSDDSYMQFVSKFKSLELQQLAKLIFLKTRMEDARYRNNSKRVKKLLAISDSIGKNSGFEYVKTVSLNLRDRYGKPKVNKTAPLFTLTDKNGKDVSLEDFRGEYVYLDFWAVWCNHCREHHKEAAKLKDKFDGKLTFISISIDRYKKSMMNYLNKHQEYDWVFLWAGEKSKVYDDYEIYGVPTNFLIDKEGKIMYITGVGIEKDFEKIKRMIND